MIDLTTVYRRAMQYCVAKYGAEPSELHLLDGGSFKAVYGDYCRGEYYEEEHYFQESCLTEDLDVVYEERKKEELRQQNLERLERERRSRERQQREKIERRNQYLKLKQEFENEDL